jgi:hypothetical protein
MQNSNHPVKFKNRFLTDRTGAGNPNYGKKHPDRTKKIKEKYGEDIFRIWAKQASNSGHYIRTNITKRKMRKVQWMGGLSFEPYTPEFNKELKAQVRKRDDYTCQLCGKHQTEPKLEIHHIDYDKKYTGFANLISLCKSCHAKTSHNREYWTNFFTDLLIERKIIIQKNS